MVVIMAVRIPVELYDRETLVVRTRDLAGRWAHPHKELRRLAAGGVVRSLAHGYWLVPPPDRLTDAAWKPEVEALALALAVADYGPDAVALMGLSAARYHGALPRAVAVAVIAAPRQRLPLTTRFGEIVFVARDTARLAVQPAPTALVVGPVTTPEQTLLDLADRPGLGGLRPAEVGETVAALAVRADWAETLVLAQRQRLHAAYVRARWVAARFLDSLPPAWPPRRPVPGLALVAGRSDDAELGVTVDAPACGRTTWASGDRRQGGESRRGRDSTCLV